MEEDKNNDVEYGARRVYDTTKSTLMTPTSDNIYQIMEDNKDCPHIPFKVKITHGCAFCEWRNTSLCPHGFKGDKFGRPLPGQIHANGICRPREFYLRSFIRKSTKPTYEEWVNDFNKGLAQTQLQHEFAKLKEAERRITELKEEGMPIEDPKFKFALKERDKFRGEWHQLFKTLNDASEKQLTREKPKEININKTVTLNDLHNIIREGEEIIDAEFKEIQGEERNDNSD